MKEQEIRDRNAHNSYLDLVEKDAREFAGDRSQLADTDCPTCASERHDEAFVKS